MRRLVLFCCWGAAVLSSCRKSERPATGETTAVVTPAAVVPAPSGIRVADVAGKWNVRVLSQTGDSALLTFVLTATADTTGWTNAFPKGPTVPVRVVLVSGDSIVTESGPHASQLRKGVQVKTRTVARLHGDTLVGETVAHYATQKADSVLHTRIRGTRAP